MFNFVNNLRAKSKITKGIMKYNECNFEQALIYYEDALKIKPNCKYALTFKGNVYDELGLYDKAFKCYDKSIDIDPHYIGAWTSKIALILESLDYDLALKIVNNGIELNKDNLELLITKTSIFLDCKNYVCALKVAEYNLKIHPKSKKCLCIKGMILSRMKNHKKAIQCYKILTEIYPSYLKGWYGLAIEYYKINDFDKAIKFLEKTISLDYNEKYVSTYIFILVEKMGDNEKGLDAINKLFDSKKKNSDEEFDATIYFLKGKIMDEQNNLEAAIKNYEKAIAGYNIAIKDYNEDLKNHGEIIKHHHYYANLDYWKKNCVFAKDRLKKLNF